MKSARSSLERWGRHNLPSEPDGQVIVTHPFRGEVPAYLGSTWKAALKASKEK